MKSESGIPLQQTNVSARLAITPAPGCILVRPFDPQAPAGIILLEPSAGSRNTTGMVVATHYNSQSITVVRDAPSRGEPGEIYPIEYTEWIQVGCQVIFPAMAGNEIELPEPTPEQPRKKQKYILLKENAVIGIVEEAVLPSINVEPRSFGA
jgi:co-chaperonin GroES (HSP10)